MKNIVKSENSRRRNLPERNGQFLKNADILLSKGRFVYTGFDY